jgi:hypothetical protein
MSYQAQAPDGPAHLICPLHRTKMSKVCKTCPLWVQIRGRDVNSGQPVDEWNCSLGWLPMLMIEMSAQARSAAAATESFRNEVAARADAAERREASAPSLAPPRRLMIEG